MAAWWSLPRSMPLAVVFLSLFGTLMLRPASAWGTNSTRRGALLISADQTPLRTSGRYIVDNRGERVKWACTNWYGAYSTTHAVGGLEVQKMAFIVDRIVDMGFNCVRMMYSTQGYVQNPIVRDEVVSANPELMGMRFQDIFDITMKAMTDAGLMVILNNHNSKSGWCCHYSQDEGLWYVPEYSEEQWIDSLVSLAARYRHDPLVVAIDLRNELHDFGDTKLTWGGGDPKTDWAAAAVRAGNRVLEASPDVLIVVMAMCFGMDLRTMKDHPIEFMYPHKTVYQTHNYLEYQVFDNISQMVAPWAEMRNVALVIGIIIILFLFCMRRCWRHIGKPMPPPGCTALSSGAWVGFCSAIAVVITTQFYAFGQLFCSVAMESDLLPWVVGSIIVLVISVLVMIFGGVRLFLWHKAGRPDSSGDQQQSSPSAGAVPDERSVPDDDQAAGPTNDKRKGCLCCAPGWASMKFACACFAKDLKKLVRFAVSTVCSIEWAKRAEDEIPSLRPQPVSWDWGTCAGLQCGIISVILLGVLITFYTMAHIIPTYWWMERHLDGLWGFALEEHYPWTAPVWMGEFGVNVRSQYWLNFVRYLSIRDVDFAYWAVNGIKWSEGYIDAGSGNFEKYDVPRWDNESFGLLDHDYNTVRHTWKLMDLQPLMESPSRWTPETFPCHTGVSSACHR